MLEQINEPIDVIVRFAGNKAIPAKFLWHDREILIQKINLVYSSFVGRTKFYYFAVSDSVNYFKLQFNTETLGWTLLEVYSE
ncbi:MAG: hypothetical protein ABI643_01925 [Candidatus Doudnabacteria bacterium]